MVVGLPEIWFRLCDAESHVGFVECEFASWCNFCVLMALSADGVQELGGTPSKVVFGVLGVVDL